MSTRANCRDGRFTTLSGDTLRFGGLNRSVPGPNEGNRPEFRILKGNEILDASSASGYSTALAQFKALCPRTVFQAENAPKAPIRSANYLGRWYEGADKSVCKDTPGTSDGLVVHTEKEMFGTESICRVVNKRTSGTQTELTYRCRGEGGSSSGREIVEVVDGRLKTTSSYKGKQHVAFYDRCP